MRLSPKQLILGSSDGTVSISGVVAAAAAQHTANGAIAKLAIAGALASAVSMAGAEMNSEKQTNLLNMVSMGLGTLMGAALPALPLLVLNGLAGWVAVALVCLVLGLAVSEIRYRMTRFGRLRTYTRTLLIMAIGIAVGWGAGVA